MLVHGRGYSRRLATAFVVRIGLTAVATELFGNTTGAMFTVECQNEAFRQPASALTCSKR